MSGRINFQPGERQAKAIRRIREISGALSSLALDQIVLMGEMSEKLHELQATDNSPEIQKLITRLDDLRCLENQQELQSWQITVDRVMAEAWRRLP